jgi:hypothetical protein
MPRKGDELPPSLWSSARGSVSPRLKSDHDRNRVHVIARPYQLPGRYLSIDGIRIATDSRTKARNERCPPAPVTPNRGMGGVGIKLIRHVRGCVAHPSIGKGAAAVRACAEADCIWAIETATNCHRACTGHWTTGEWQVCPEVDGHRGDRALGDCGNGCEREGRCDRHCQSDRG